MTQEEAVRLLGRLAQLGESLSYLRDMDKRTAVMAASLAREAHGAGATVSEIAVATGVSRPTVYAWLKLPKGVDPDGVE